MTLIGWAWIIGMQPNWEWGFMGNFNLVPRFVGIKVQDSTINQYVMSILKFCDIYIVIITSRNNIYNNKKNYYIFLQGH